MSLELHSLKNKKAISQSLQNLNYVPRNIQPTSGLFKRHSVNDVGHLPLAKLTLRDFYEVLGLLGEGVSSQVFMAQNKKNGEHVAVKVIPKSKLINNVDLAHEISILKKISHHNIVALKDVFITPEHLQIIMELADGQELFDEICDRKTFTEEDARDIILKLLDAVGYLHENGIAHRDLKPENIMFVQDKEGNKKLKVIDFGFARNCSETNLLHTPAGTLGYKAPEILNGEPYSTKADMWAVGVISHILLVGYPPFLSDNDNKDVNTLMNAPFWTLFNDETDTLLDAIKNGKVDYPQEFWGNISLEAKDFVQSLLKVNANERASARQSLNHPWLKSTKLLEPPKEETKLANNSSIPDIPKEVIDFKSPVPDNTTTDFTTPLQAPAPSSIIRKTAELYKIAKRRKSIIRDSTPDTKVFQLNFCATGIPELDLLVGQTINNESEKLNPITDENDENLEKVKISSKSTNCKPKMQGPVTHKWRKISSPTYCSCCDEFIFGVVQEPGLKCKNCKIVAHQYCMSNVDRICERKKSRKLSKKARRGDNEIRHEYAKKEPLEISPKTRSKGIKGSQSSINFGSGTPKNKSPKTITKSPSGRNQTSKNSISSPTSRSRGGSHSSPKKSSNGNHKRRASTGTPNRSTIEKDETKSKTIKNSPSPPKKKIESPKKSRSKSKTNKEPLRLSKVGETEDKLENSDEKNSKINKLERRKSIHRVNQSSKEKNKLERRKSIHRIDSSKEKKIESFTPTGSKKKRRYSMVSSSYKRKKM